MVLDNDYNERYQSLDVSGFNEESNIYIDGNKLYKIYDQDIKNMKQREYYIDELMNLQYIKNAVWPKDKIYIVGKFAGVVIDYKPKCQNLSAIYQKLTIDEAISMGNKLSSSLRSIHDNGLIVGDIHDDNIITDCHDYYFCDLDGMKFEIENSQARTLYSIMYNNNSPIINDNQMTDNIKLLICVLSALYHYDFVNIVMTKGTEFLQILIYNLNLPLEVKNIMMAIFGLETEQPYFYEYSKVLNNNLSAIEQDKQTIEQKVKFLKN